MILTVTLPWVPKALWPNSYRPHWAEKAAATNSARYAAKMLTLEAMKGSKWPSSKAVLQWVFHPKTKRAPDRTNCIIGTKAWEDGIADAIGVNDRLFEANYRIGEPIKGGMVVVTVCQA